MLAIPRMTNKLSTIFDQTYDTTRLLRLPQRVNNQLIKYLSIRQFKERDPLRLTQQLARHTQKSPKACKTNAEGSEFDLTEYLLPSRTRICSAAVASPETKVFQASLPNLPISCGSQHITKSHARDEEYSTISCKNRFGKTNMTCRISGHLLL